MDTKKIVDTAKKLFEERHGTYKLFQLAPEIENYCIDECFRLAQSDTRNPPEPAGIDRAPAWQQISALVCRVEFDEVLARVRAERLAAR